MLLTINGTTFDPETPDVDSDVLAVDDILGWDAPTMENFIHETMKDGDVISFSRYGHFALVVQGHAFTPVRGNHARLRNKLALAFDTKTPVTMTVTNDNFTDYSLAVRRNGELRIEKIGPHVVEFEVDMISTSTTKTVV